MCINFIKNKIYQDQDNTNQLTFQPKRQRVVGMKHKTKSILEITFESFNCYK